MAHVLITGCSVGHRPRRRPHARGPRLAGAGDLPAAGGLRAAGGRGAGELPARPRRRGGLAAAAAEALARTGGRIDALFNNGAFAIPGAVEDLPRAALREIFETNLFGQVDLTNRLLPAMRAAGRGRMVMTSSVLGVVAAPWRGAYIATKFALEGITDTLRLELAGSGIHVVLIEPGPIATPFRAERRSRISSAHIDWRASPHRAAYEATLLRAALPARRAPRPLRAAAGGGDREADPRARKPAAGRPLPGHAAGARRRAGPPRFCPRG